MDRRPGYWIAVVVVVLFVLTNLVLLIPFAFPETESGPAATAPTGTAAPSPTIAVAPDTPNVAPRFIEFSTRIQKNAAGFQKYVFAALVPSLLFLGGAATVILGLILFAGLLKLLFQPGVIVLEDLDYSGSDESLMGAVKILSMQARQRMKTDLESLRDILKEDSQRLTGETFKTDLISERLNNDFDHRLEGLIKSVEAVAPGEVKPVIQYLTQLIPQQVVRIRGKILFPNGGAVTQASPIVAIEAVDSQDRFAPILFDFKDIDKPEVITLGTFIPGETPKWSEFTHVGERLMEVGEFEDALIYLDRVVNFASPDTKEAKFAAATIAACVTQLQSRRSAEAAYTLGEQHLGAGKIEQAIHSYLTALPFKDRRNAQVCWKAILSTRNGKNSTGRSYHQLACLYRQVHLEQQAANLYMLAAEHGDAPALDELQAWHLDDARSLGEVGRRLISVGRLSEAQKYLEKGLAKAPEDAGLRADLVTVIAQQKNKPSSTTVDAVERARRLLYLGIRVVSIEILRNKMLYQIDRLMKRSGKFSNLSSSPGLYQDYRGSGRDSAQYRKRIESRINRFIGVLYQHSMSSEGYFTSQIEFFEKSIKEFQNAQKLDQTSLVPSLWKADVYATAWQIKIKDVHAFQLARQTYEHVIDRASSDESNVKLRAKIRFAQLLMETKKTEDFESAQKLINEILLEEKDLYLLAVKMDYPFLYNMACWYGVANKRLAVSGVDSQEAEECYHQARLFLPLYALRDEHEKIWGWAEQDPDLDQVRHGMVELKREISSRWDSVHNLAKISEPLRRSMKFAAIVTEVTQAAKWEW